MCHHLSYLWAGQPHIHFPRTDRGTDQLSSPSFIFVLLSVSPAVFFSLPVHWLEGEKEQNKALDKMLFTSPRYCDCDRPEGHTTPSSQCFHLRLCPRGASFRRYGSAAEAADLLKWTAVQFYCLLGKERDFVGNTDLPSSLGNKGCKRISGHTFWQTGKLSSFYPSLSSTQVPHGSYSVSFPPFLPPADTHHPASLFGRRLWLPFCSDIHGPLHEMGMWKPETRE